MCENPTAAEARIVGSGNDKSTVQIVEFGIGGLKCLNDKQTDGSCADYEVRYCCPTAHWKEIYSQTVPSPLFGQNSILGDCNFKIDDENFINFDNLENLEEYEFKFVWDGGKPNREQTAVVNVTKIIHGQSTTENPAASLNQGTKVRLAMKRKKLNATRKRVQTTS